MIVDTLKMLCKKKGVSFSEFERESGIGMKTASRWDKNSPSIDKVILAAEYFGITVSELIGEQKNPAPSDGDGQVDKINSIVDSLSPDSVQRVLEYAELLLLKQTQQDDSGSRE